jgi:predicted GNAT superfamily acetyltransferase
MEGAALRVTGARALQRRDSAQVLAINLVCRPGVAPLDQQELSRLMSLPHEHLVAARGNELVGYLLAFQHDAPYDGEEFLAFRGLLTAPYLYVDQVAVAAGLRHSGIGRCLYQEISSVARRRGLGLLCCEVNIRPANQGSMAFHEQLGFSPVTRLATRDGREVQLMTKTLTGTMARRRR